MQEERKKVCVIGRSKAKMFGAIGQFLISYNITCTEGEKKTGGEILPIREND